MLLLALQNDPIEQRWEGKGSRIEQPGVQLITGAESWKNLWRRHAAEEPPPVDFKTHVVVAVFPEGDYHSIRSSAISDKEITLTIVLGGKEANAYAPHHSIVLLPRTSKPIRVILRVNSCTGIDPSRDKVFLLNLCRAAGSDAGPR